MNQQLDEKEVSLKEQFNNEQKKAGEIEEQIKQLQGEHQQCVVNMTRLQGAFGLLQELKTKEEEPGGSVKEG